MRSGVSYPTYAPTFTLAAGTPDSDYPVANLGDLSAIRTVFKATGAVQISFTLPAAVLVGLVSLVHHNAGAAATWQVVLKNGGATVADSGVVALSGPGIFPAVTPYAPAAAVTCDNGTITLSSQAWSIGGLDISGFWSFTDVAVPRELGLQNNDATTELLGADHTAKLFNPRTLVAARAISDVTTDQNTVLDFQKEKRGQPFIWVWDADDPATWARECWLAKAPDPEPYGKLAHPSGRVSFKFREHLG